MLFEFDHLDRFKFHFQPSTATFTFVMYLGDKTERERGSCSTIAGPFEVAR